MSQRRLCTLYGTTVLTLNSCTKGVGSLGIIHDRTPDCHPVSRAWMYGWPHYMLRVSLMCLAYFFKVLSMGVCKTRQWEMAGQLVQELTLMLLVANFACTKWCKNPEKRLKPWHIGTHLRVLSESFQMNTNMTGFRWFSKIFVSLCLGRK